MNRITIKDIARLLSLNVSTVSRALSNHPDVNVETRQRVIAVAAEMGYTPNSLAVNLRRKHSGLVALLISEINMFFIPSVIRAIEAQMRQNGYRIIILQSNDMLELEMENLKICRQLAVEGILVSLSANTQNLDHFAPLFDDGIPIVFLDKVPMGNYDTVTIDDEKIGWRATQHLTGQGHRAIFGLFGPPAMRITQQRLLGYRRALAEAGIQRDDAWEVFADSTKQAHFRLLERIRQTSGVTALFAMSDELLVGVIPAAETAGYRILSDLSVICISDGAAPEFYHPRITHLKHSGFDIGSAASQRLLELLADSSQPPQQIQMKCDLIDLYSIKNFANAPY